MVWMSGVMVIFYWVGLVCVESGSEVFEGDGFYNNRYK